MFEEKKIPKDGLGTYRATALAYLEREQLSLENRNGMCYTKEQLRNAIGTVEATK